MKVRVPETPDVTGWHGGLAPHETTGYHLDLEFDIPVEYHPVNDLKPHHLLGSGLPCWCKPVDEDGVLVHNSLDGREAFEDGERKFS